MRPMNMTTQTEPSGMLLSSCKWLSWLEEAGSFDDRRAPLLLWMGVCKTEYRKSGTAMNQPIMQSASKRGTKLQDSREMLILDWDRPPSPFFC